MRQGGEPQGVQVVRQGKSTPYHYNFNPLYICVMLMFIRCILNGKKQPALGFSGCRLLLRSVNVEHRLRQQHDAQHLHQYRRVNVFAPRHGERARGDFVYRNQKMHQHAGGQTQFQR